MGQGSCSLAPEQPRAAAFATCEAYIVAQDARSISSASACPPPARLPQYISHLRTFMVLWLAVVPWVFVVYFDW